MEEKTITIITAAWHHENLGSLIASIDAQTYTNWHHIIVNDNNPEIRKELEGLYRTKKRLWIDLGFRTHYYGALARDIGVITAFSYVHHSKRDIENEWVCFHDDDNIWNPDHLETMMAKVEGDISLVASDALWIGANDPDWQELRRFKPRHGGCDLGQFIYKTKLFRKYGYFFPHPRRKHKYDWELISKMLKGEAGRIAYTNNASFILNYRKK